MNNQQIKFSDKINKISSKITSENINNKIKEINDKFNNKQIKYQAANKAINDQFKLFKLNNKINTISKNFKLNKNQAVKKYIKDEK